MKAVIMAGGEGNRLRPLTCDIPKPMARLLGRPILEYIVELLASHDVEEAAITLRYLPHCIADHFADSAHAGVKLRFVEEEEPLGTAGGVKNACQGDNGEILVISGDAMCDFNLGAFAAWHRAKNADVSILGKQVQDPREYGLIACDNESRISGFIEKPAFSQAVSDIANTGIYLLSARALELIPEGKVFDFAKDLFPLMLAAGMNLCCWEGAGYWCDIGDLDSYIRCQQDMLRGKVRCEIHGARDRHGNIFAGGRPYTAADIQAPVYVGKHARVDETAVLQSGTVIDEGCYIAPSARVTGSVLLQNAYIGRRARLTGALVCATATVGAGCMLFEGSTLGAGAMLGERSTVAAGVRIWNNKRIAPASAVNSHVKTSAQARDFFDDDGISGQVGVELIPELLARMGAAVGSLGPRDRIAVGCSGDRGAAVLKAALCAGIRSTGADVIDFGESFLAQFEFSMNFCAVSMGVFIRGGSRASIKVISAGGLPSTREMERRIEALLARGEFVRCAGEDMGDIVEMSGMAPMYKSQLARCAPKGLTGCKAIVKSHSLTVQNILKEALHRLGCDVTDGVTLEVSSQGDKVRVSDPSLGYVRHHTIYAWCCLSEMERGEDIAVPYDAPRAIDEMAKELGRKALRYYTCPADDSDAAARDLAKNQMWSRDALMQAIMFLDLTRRAGGVGALLEGAPAFDRAERTLDTGGNPAALLKKLGAGEESQGIPEGIVLREKRGVALVRPLKRGTGVRIFAEAVNAEIADELCADIERRLTQASADATGETQSPP